MKNQKKIKIEDFNILYDNILVKAVPITEKRGVIIPSTNETKPELGEVILVGEGRFFDNGHLEPLRIKVGDIIYFNQYSTTKFNIDGETYYMLREEDCMGYIRN